MIALEETPAFFRIRGLLEAAGWRADDDLIARALPHLSDTVSATDFVAAIRNLGIGIDAHRCDAARIRQDDCPCLFIPDNGPMRGIFTVEPDRVFAQADDAFFPGWEPIQKEQGLLLRLANADDAAELAGSDAADDLSGFLSGLRPTLASVFLISLLTNLLAFAPPILVMVTYDRAIPAGSSDFLFALLFGTGLAVLTDILLRFARTKALSRVAGNVDAHMGNLLFRKLMRMPLDQLTRSDANQQLSRLKQFVSIRDIFTGQALISVFDLPFSILFGAVIYAFSPMLGLAVLATAVLYGIAYLIFAPIQKRLSAAAAASRLALQGLETELIGKQKHIRRLGAGETWLKRAAAMNRRAAEDARHAREISLSMQGLGQTLMMLAGAMTIYFGAQGAIDGTLSLGALVATMSLVWRALGPLQALYGSASQITGQIQSLKQIQRMAALPEELRLGARQSRHSRVRGHLQMEAASFRYRREGDPVIINTSLTAEPGQIIAVTGQNGAGKTTLLNLLASLYTPMSGSVLLDGMDMRQIPVDNLRGSFSYMPQSPDVFYGTIAQNFRLASILISDKEIWDILDILGIADDIRTLPDGLNTRLNDATRATMSQSVLKTLSVARGLVKDVPVYICDEPANGIARDIKIRMENHLRSLARDGRTVIFSTRFLSSLDVADRVIQMEAGRIAMDEPNPTAKERLRAQAPDDAS